MIEWSIFEIRPHILTPFKTVFHVEMLFKSLVNTMFQRILVVLFLSSLGATQDFDYFEEEITTTTTKETPPTTLSTEPQQTELFTTDAPTTSSTEPIMMKSCKMEESLILNAINRLESKADKLFPTLQTTTTKTITTVKDLVTDLTTTTSNKTNTTPPTVRRFVEEDVFEDEFFLKNVSFDKNTTIDTTIEKTYQFDTITIACSIGVTGSILTASAILTIICCCCHQKKNGKKEMEMKKLGKSEEAPRKQEEETEECLQSIES